MPELPEVHTITGDLKKYVSGSTVKKMNIEKEYSPKFDPKKFTKLVVGSKITNVERVSKNIVFELSSGNYLNVHLRLTGRLLLRSKGYKKDQWQKIVFILEKKW